MTNDKFTSLAISISLMLLLTIFISPQAQAQKQLVLLNGQKVLLNLKPGDDFVFRIKGQKEIRRTYINNLSDTAIVTHRDTVAFHRIDRVYFKRSSFANVVGTVLVIGGAGYFLIDQFNNVVVQGNSAELDEGVTKASVTMLAVGLPMMLIKRNSERLGRGSRLMMVTEESPFYHREIRQMF